MKRLSCTFVLGTAILFLGPAGPAQADPVTYTASGFATGTLGGLAFTNALVVVTATGDTDNAIPNPEFEEDGFLVPAGIFFGNISFATTVDIAGIGIATLTDPSGIFAFTIPLDLDEDGDIDPPGIVIGTLDNPPDVMGGFTGIAGTLNDGLLGYDLQTSIGPITGPGGVGYPQRLIVNTNRGALSFTENILQASEGTFTATVTTPPAKVPEPGSLLLLGTGLVAALGVRSRFRGSRRTTSN